MAQTQEIVISLNTAPPPSLFILLMGTVDAGGLDSTDNDALQQMTRTYNLSQLHPGALNLGFPLDPQVAKVCAVAGLTSINNSDKADEWTWAVDEVVTRFENGELILAVKLAGQGGQGGEILYVDTVLAGLTYAVTVLIN